MFFQEYRQFSLRDYQERDIARLREAFTRHHRVVYVLPTGGGKTVLFSFMARKSAELGKRVMILVHRRELIHQTCAKLAAPHGVIAAGFTPDYHESIQVVSVQTAVRRKDVCSGFSFIVVDECHHTTASTYQAVLALNPDAHVLGVTATPARMDGHGLDSLFDVLVEGPDVKTLTESGHLAPAVVYAPSLIDVSGCRTRMGDYAHGDLADAADKPTITGDALEQYRKFADRAPSIAFCVSVEHAHHVAAAFRAAGYRACAVDGGMNQAERDRVIAALGRGEVEVLTSCDLISEGVDVPVVKCGILLRPTKSLTLAMQQIGRILRPAPGKDRAVILDHAGNCLRHGLPTTERQWTLQGFHKQRKKDDEEIRVRRCPVCFAVHEPAKQCPYCGHVYQPKPRRVKTVNGELLELTEEEMKERKTELAKARTLDALREIGRMRGYKPGWAYKMAAIRGKRNYVGPNERTGT